MRQVLGHRAKQTLNKVNLVQYRVIDYSDRKLCAIGPLASLRVHAMRCSERVRLRQQYSAALARWSHAEATYLCQKMRRCYGARRRERETRPGTPSGFTKSAVLIAWRVDRHRSITEVGSCRIAEQLAHVQPIRPFDLSHRQCPGSSEVSRRWIEEGDCRKFLPRLGSTLAGEITSWRHIIG